MAGDFDGLLRAVMMSADKLAAKKGEDNPLVQIKRNHERIDGCPGHLFLPQPGWRSTGILSRLRVPCTRCGGELPASEVLIYLRGFAHGSGQDYTEVSNAVFPPGTEARRGD